MTDFANMTTADTDYIHALKIAKRDLKNELNDTDADDAWEIDRLKAEILEIRMEIKRVKTGAAAPTDNQGIHA